MCGVVFGSPRRVCELDAGHSGDHAGRIDPQVFKAARRRYREAVVRGLNVTKEKP
jgi:hypothetical protein